MAWLWTELLLGVIPITAFYVHLFPIAFFWTVKVFELAIDRRIDRFTTSIAAVFVGGGIGLVSLWSTLLRRLFTSRSIGPVITVGLCIGILAAAAATTISWFLYLPKRWYFVYGAAVVVAGHQIYAGARARRSGSSTGSPSSGS